MRTTTLLTCAALCAAACTVRADVEAKLTRDGHVTFGDTGLALSPTVYAEGWHGTAFSRAERFSKFPDAKTGTAAWILKGSRNTQLGHGKTRLVAAERQPYEKDALPVASFKLEELRQPTLAHAHHVGLPAERL